MTTSYTIQIDEETGGDETWDALHDYAARVPPPACLRVYTDRAVCWPDPTTVNAAQAQEAKRWLTVCAKACGWDARTTPLLVIPGDAEEV
jgi:hypothetical protein